MAKTSFLALFCINYANYAYLITYAWPLSITKYWETFWTIIICNIMSIWALKLEKMAKTSFLALFCINYANYAYLINHAWPLTMTKCWETFWTIIICNVRSIRAPKLEKMAKNLIFGSFLHKLCKLFIPN